MHPSALTCPDDDVETLTAHWEMDKSSIYHVLRHSNNLGPDSQTPFPSLQW